MNFTSNLTLWYKENKRDLPWRKTKEPYLIWLSEVILQQTRIQQGMSYFARFQQAFPTVFDLADASEESVLKLWQGLGYYSRARNLHFAAKTIVNELNGNFPGDFSQIKKLKGVGDYTAAAIASICFDEPVAVVDGNVFRVLARVYGIDQAIDQQPGKKVFFDKAMSLIDKTDPGTFNQALMEFGALQCVPKNPDCSNCIFSCDCFAFNHNKVSHLPVKRGKVVVKNRFFNYLVFSIISSGASEQFTLVRKRNKNDIWRNLYDFPMVESNHLYIASELVKFIEDEGIPSIELKSVSSVFTHILTHQKIQAQFFTLFARESDKLLKYFGENVEIISADDFLHKPLPRLIERYAEQNPNLFG